MPPSLLDRGGRGEAGRRRWGCGSGVPVGRRPGCVQSRLGGPVRHRGPADGLGRVRLADAPPDPCPAGDAARGHSAVGRRRLRG